jgi:hypothetical protein
MRLIRAVPSPPSSDRGEGIQSGRTIASGPTHSASDPDHPPITAHMRSLQPPITGNMGGLDEPLWAGGTRVGCCIAVISPAKPSTSRQVPR